MPTFDCELRRAFARGPRGHRPLEAIIHAIAQPEDSGMRATFTKLADNFPAR